MTDVQVTTGPNPLSQVSPAPPQQNAVALSKAVVIAVIIFLLLFFSFTLWYVFGYKSGKTVQTSQIQQPATVSQSTIVSGTVTMEGYYSPDSYIAIAERKLGKTDFKDVISGIVPSSASAKWQWKDADKGGNYELKATLKVKGKEIDESPITLISAPAAGIELHIVSDQQPPVPVKASIGGTIHIDGYIPPNSMINVLAKELGTTTFVQIATGISPTDEVGWSWSGAISGKTYILKSQLIGPSGSSIASSDQDTATAPSSEEAMQIDSHLTPPQPAITGLSGTITINGSIPTNSYITLGTRQTGSGNFNQVASNISASSGVSWSWNSANTGTSYDVQAYLWSNGQPYAQSPVTTLVAPSLNNVLVINAAISLSAPASNSITVTCNSQQSGQYLANINFNTTNALSNAQQYRIVVTQASTGNQVVSTTITPGNPGNSQSITTNAIFSPSVTYYAQYAYSTNTNGNFSPLSSSYQFSCQ